MELEAQEAKALLFLREKGEAWTEEVERGTGLDPSTLMRAVLGLSQRGYLSVREEHSFLLSLTEEGRRYASGGLPERRMLERLAEGEKPVEEVLSGGKEEATIALGWLRRKGLAEVMGGKVRLTAQGKEALSKEWPEEGLLRRLSEGELSLSTLSPEAEILRRRGLVEVREKVRRLLSLTEEGRRAAAGVRVVEEVTELTREMLVTGRWREVKFKRYDPSEGVPPLHPGRIHPQQRVIEEVREALLAMGFVEIKSRVVESEFWNFDALFQAQDHPAREIHSNFTLSRPSKTRLPHPDLVRRVARAHERGVEGSTGWGYRFNPEVSRRAVLCSQTTAATVRYLSSHPHPPLKVFCIDRVYRHERIDYKHLAEFYQCEGIVMDEGLTFRDMLGYLKLILTTLGFEKVRFRPGYFPFTEPSVEAEVYHPKRGEWVEVLGAGMFRPELLRPLGVKHPVLAWGIGLSRLVMMRLGLEDIRDLFCNDLETLQGLGLRRG
ncbi:MAG: phenylalanine--tRNA ligase subunit alpha [Candidatus Hadarchaeales archaeon]